MTRPMVWLASAVAVGGLLAGHPAVGQPKKGEPGASLGVASLPNPRDAGGYKTRDGRVVRPGLLYRSSQPARVKPADQGKLAAPGLKTAFDLRTAAER